MWLCCLHHELTTILVAVLFTQPPFRSIIMPTPTLDTESPPKVMRRLDYSNDEVHDSNDNNDNGGDMNVNAQQQQQGSFTSPMPTSPQSRSRNTLSSRTSLLGRRLAEERSRNHQLTIELEHVKSLLKRNNNDHYDNDDVFSLNESFYSSSPVNTPTATPVKQQPDSTTTTAAAAAVKEDDENCKNELLQHKQRIQELENALQTTQTKLISAEQYAASLKEKIQNLSFIGNDSAIHEYMERASLLICNSSFTNTPNNTSNGYNNNNGSHHSYNSLHSIDEEEEEDDEDEDEIIDNTENDVAAAATTFGICLSNLLSKMQEYDELVTSFHLEQQSNPDETMTKEDILWFFGELKWRFANIHHGVAKLSKEVLTGNNNCDASSKTQQDNIQELKDCLTGLVDELNYSMQKARENKINDNNDACQRDESNESVMVIKQRYEEQLASQKLRIQQLEKDVKDQEEHFSGIQKKMKNDYHLIEEEKRKLALSKDGTAARIRYLEDMLKKAQTTTKSVNKKKDHDCKRGNDGYASEIDTLAKALTDSELKRALLIEEFQAEREKYITQYKQMNDVLKGFMDNPL